MKMASRCIVATGLGLALASAPATASFHLMQIEQVIAGVCGRMGEQAIQLRMRFADQNLVAGRQLVAWDNNGNNPIVLITFPTDVTVDAQGSRILAVTSGLASAGVATDFTLTQPIPTNYLRWGRLTFEDGFGLGAASVYWSLAWGEYNGDTTGRTDNDADGQFGPAEGGLLPFSTARALRFQGAAADLSTDNVSDYALTTGPATVTRNDGTATVLQPSCVFGDGFEVRTEAWAGSTDNRCDGDDAETLEQFPLGETCERPDGQNGVFVCGSDGVSLVCS